jgi:Icc protein
MRRVAWLTDLHLNYVSQQQASAFFDELKDLPVDTILMGGDFSESSRLLFDLSELSARVRKPVRFVLGPSDYYRSSIANVRTQVSQLCSRMPNLTYLSESPFIEISEQTALLGHDGWGDGMAGKAAEMIQLNDELQIAELTTYDRHTLHSSLRELGQQAADHLRATLSAALERFNNICLLMHVPPFREACWFDGAPAEDRIASRFTCLNAGIAIFELMQANPTKQLTVLCGHTHSPGVANILPNVQVWTGSAQYGKPQVQRLFWIP